MPQFKNATAKDITEVKETAKILLVTATDVETSALHEHLRPLHPRARKCLTQTAGNQTYYIGRFGSYAVIHVQCQMGSISPGASNSTVAEALSYWNIKAVVMVGIAFGVDQTKQKIGDVLISKNLCLYEIKRVGESEEIQRGSIPPCGAKLLNRFSNSLEWTHALGDEQNARLISTNMLSGESLIDNHKHLAKLLESFPQAEGGEMEGTGVFSAAHQDGVEWILVKAICDFADGKKSQGKKAKQKVAAESAASLCFYVFSQSGTFRDLGCPDWSTKEQVDSVQLTQENVLFEVYNEACESAYLERNSDSEIAAVIERQGVWISGPAGCGKTNALKRNLIVAGKKIKFIDLSRCVGATVAELFECLYLELAEGFSTKPIKVPAKRNIQRVYIGEIAKLIENNVKEETHIFIDEVPLDGNEFDTFFDGISAIIVTLANKDFHKAPFLLATIGTPKNSDTKLCQHMRLIHMPLWTNTEMKALMTLIGKLLPLNLSKEEQFQITTEAGGCPRSLKKMLKDWCMFRETPGWTLGRVINEFNIG